MSALPEDLTEPAAPWGGAPEVRRWRDALQQGEFGVWDLDVPGEVVHYPAAWKTRLGFPRAEAADPTGFWRCRVHPQDFGGMLQALQSHAEGDRPAYEAVFRLRSNGSGYRTMRSRGRVVARDPDGRPLRIVGTMVDLTGRATTPRGWGLVMDDDQPWPATAHVPLHALLGADRGRRCAPAPAPEASVELQALLAQLDDLLALATRDAQSVG